MLYTSRFVSFSTIYCTYLFNMSIYSHHSWGTVPLIRLRSAHSDTHIHATVDTLRSLLYYYLYEFILYVYCKYSLSVVYCTYSQKLTIHIYSICLLYVFIICCVLYVFTVTQTVLYCVPTLNFLHIDNTISFTYHHACFYSTSYSPSIASSLFTPICICPPPP